MQFIVIFSEFTEKQCVKEKYPHVKAKIRLMLHCAAISAIAELLSSYYIALTKEAALN